MRGTSIIVASVHKTAPCNSTSTRIRSIFNILLDVKIPADFDSEYIILDLAHAHRIESTAARCAGELELRKQTLVICGLAKASGLRTNFPGEGFVGV
jgi:hypothetical protein